MLKSNKILEDNLDIQNLMKAQVFNRLAFKFVLTKQEYSYIKLLEKRKRVLVDNHETSDDKECNNDLDYRPKR